ncbi:MAG: hypothetical protein U0232_18465 [Thermomicrobiales bacterium]
MQVPIHMSRLDARIEQDGELRPQLALHLARIRPPAQPAQVIAARATGTACAGPPTTALRGGSTGTPSVRLTCRPSAPGQVDRASANADRVARQFTSTPAAQHPFVVAAHDRLLIASE